MCKSTLVIKCTIAPWRLQRARNGWCALLGLKSIGFGSAGATRNLSSGNHSESYRTAQRSVDGNDSAFHWQRAITYSRSVVYNIDPRLIRYSQYFRSTFNQTQSSFVRSGLVRTFPVHFALSLLMLTKWSLVLVEIPNERSSRARSFETKVARAKCGQDVLAGRQLKFH